MSTYDNQTGRLAPQSILHQRYLIVGYAGRGGMSAVYQAVDTKSGNHHVAIKEMSQGHLSTNELADATARFQQEADLLGSLHHPNLPPIYDGFSEDGRSYLVMEYIDGKTLLQMLKDSGGRPLPVAQVLDYAIQLCDVLIYLHSHHPPIIFRDLKPTNVMVTGNGHVVLIDFGIARLFKEGQAQDTVFLGSPGYAPPEQHGTAQTNPRSDLYSLGATLHCCLTGRDPFHASDRFAFPPIYQINPLVPLELDQLIQRMVSLNEQQRPNSALEVRQALLKIKQQASDNTTGLDPVMASAPTQYNPPAPTSTSDQVPIRSTNPVSTHPPTVPVGASPDYGQLPPITRTPQTKGITSIAAVWTPRFIILFGLILALTVVGSIIAFNISQPYGSTNPAGLDHAVELGLSVILLLVAIGAIWFVRNGIAIAILLLTALSATNNKRLPAILILCGISRSKFTCNYRSGSCLSHLIPLANPPIYTNRQNHTFGNIWSHCHLRILTIFNFRHRYNQTHLPACITNSSHSGCVGCGTDGTGSNSKKIVLSRHTCTLTTCR
jgi:serine/threonine protein kinase